MAKIKISKVAKDLNIALPTVIDFLQSKGINIDMNPNSRIDEAAYDMLIAQYSDDKAEKSKSEKLSSVRQKEKRPATPADSKPEEIKIEPMVRPTVVGHIDLDAKKSHSKKEAPRQPEAAEPEVKPTPAPEKPEAPKAQEEKKPAVPEVKPEEKPAPKAPVAEEKPKTERQAPAQPAEKPAPKAQEMKKPEAPKAKPEEKPAPKAPAAEEKPKTERQAPVQPADKPAPKSQETAPKKEEEIFSPSSVPAGPQLNVIGKIDLSAINQQTRPKKKTKEERRNERLAKNGQGAAGQAGAGQSGDRKKRRRIGKEKVDIEKTSNQQPSRGGERGGNNNNGGQRHERGAGKNKDRNKRQIHAEVSEEDVQKQVKETLARLINKDKGQKKGVKWRKEKREAFQSREREAAEMEAAESKVLKLTEFVTANDLAVMMDVPVNNVIATCMNLGVMVSINQRLDAETINIVAEEFGFKTEYVSAEVVEAIQQDDDNEEDLQTRPPIVTA